MIFETLKQCQACDRNAQLGQEMCRDCSIRISGIGTGIKWAAWLFAFAAAVSLLYSCSAASGRQFQTHVTEQFLDWTSWLESRHNPYAVGAAGESGPYQISPVGLEELYRVFGWRLTHVDVQNHSVGRDAARLLLLELEDRLWVHLRRQPTIYELREAYRRGVHGFLRMRKHGPIRPEAGEKAVKLSG